jgi:hypothetical protein
MTDRKFSLRFTQSFLVIALLLLASITDAVEIAETELLSLMNEKDAQLKMVGCNISFLMTEQSHKSDPRQGLVHSHCEANWQQKDSLVMKKSYVYEKDIPVFVPPEANVYGKNEYDDHGNLIVWRNIESYILFSPEQNDRIQKIRALRIDPNGKLVSEGKTKIMLHRYPIGSNGNIYEFNRLKLATGRGFSDSIQSITSTKILPSGVMQITAPQKNGNNWELTIDPNSDYLVRKAVLMQEEMSEPKRIVTSEGSITKHGITLGKFGTYKYSGSPLVNFEVIDISKISGHNELYEEVLSFLNSSLPPGSIIVDLRGDKPIRSTVK